MNRDVVPSGHALGLCPPPCRNARHSPIYGELRAIEHIRRMRGGSQSQLMRCSDGHYYVVKFPNNPQGARILFNDLFGSRLAARLGLPVAVAETVTVEQSLVDLCPELTIEDRHGRKPCQAGKCFGSRLPLDPPYGRIYDFMPLSMVRNRLDFLGMLVFDKWTCNTDGRQAVFHRQGKSPKLMAVMIDQGWCFNEWTFPDSPLRGCYYRLEAYESVSGMDAFEPWLSRLESEIDENSIFAAAETIPTEWYDGDACAFARLLERLNRRRHYVRELLWSTWKSTPQVFPNWQPSGGPRKMRVTYRTVNPRPKRLDKSPQERRSSIHVAVTPANQWTLNKL
jgi:hypothetical protein